MRRRFMVLMALIILLIGTLVTPRPAQALPKTIAGQAYIEITNKNEAYYAGITAKCKATIHFPDGSTQVAYGQCISGWRYAVPKDGTYAYVGTLQPDGTYDIVIDSSVSDPANPGAFRPGDMLGTQQMGKIRVRYEPRVTVAFTKRSANATFTAGNGEYAYAGATYDIFDARNDSKVATITTDEQGNAALALEPEASFYAIETKAPPGFKLNPKRVDFTTGMTPNTVDLPDEPGSFVLSIQKKDSATGGPAQAGASLKGAEYLVTSRSTAGWSQTGVTDANGRLVIGNIPLGTIVVTETKAPVGYKLDDTPHEFHVAAGQLNQEGTFELKPVDEFREDITAFDIDIIKTLSSRPDGSGLQTLAHGVRFDIISNTTNAIVGSITTDERGFATTEGKWFGAGERTEGINGALPYDKEGYTIREDPETTPEGYQACENWTIEPEEMADGITLHFAVRNAAVLSRLQIVKTDAESGQVVPLAGFEFRLLDKHKRPVTQDVWHPSHSEQDTFTTDETGTVTLPEQLLAGTYYIREISAVPPYLLNGEDIKFTIKANANTPPVTVICVEDEQARGTATIKKTCDEKGESLEGAEFDVIAMETITSPDGTVQAAEGEIVDHVKTGADGTATTDELPLGDGTAQYAFVETKAPDGHILDATPRPFTLTYEDAKTEVVHTAVDVANKASHLRIEKRVLGTGAPLAGVEFSYWRMDAELSVAPDEAGAVAVRLDAGAAVSLSRTQPANDKQEAIELTYSKKDDAHIGRGLAAGDYEVVVDGKPVGTVHVGSRASYATVDAGKLTSVPILLADNSKIGSTVTDETGCSDLLHLKTGAYRLLETAAPRGFVKSDELFSFTVDENGRVEGKDTYTITVENDHTKVDISTRSITDEKELPGAKLTLTDKKGKVIERWTSTEEPHRIDNLAPGDYILVEEMTPQGFDKAQSVPFTVAETCEIQHVVMHDEPIEVNAQIDKRQEIARPIAPNTESDGDDKNRADAVESRDGLYSYTLDFRNTSSTWVDEFTVEDRLHMVDQGLAEMMSLTTPQAGLDYDGLLNVWYRTNLSTEDEDGGVLANATLDDAHENPWLTDPSNKETLGDDGRAIHYAGWRLWRSGLPATEATTLDVSDLGLADGEAIVAIRLEYGRVEKGFTTRIDDWERDDLKHDHDDMRKAPAEHEGQTFTVDGQEVTYAPAVIGMRVTDEYREGTKLDNEARVDAYRNGGGEALEGHDEDHVTQRPKEVTPPPVLETPLGQTGDPASLFGIALLAGAGLTLWGWGLLARKVGRCR